MQPKTKFWAYKCQSTQNIIVQKHDFTFNLLQILCLRNTAIIQGTFDMNQKQLAMTHEDPSLKLYRLVWLYWIPSKSRMMHIHFRKNHLATGGK